jgi:hypothetical protein
VKEVNGMESTIERGKTYLCFTQDVTTESACAKFVKRYGSRPAQTVKQFRMLWVGPIPNTETGFRREGLKLE